MDFFLSNTPIILEGSKVQKRKHRKKRINKKYAKRYGFEYISNLKNGDVLYYNGALYMNIFTYESLSLDKMTKIYDALNNGNYL